MPRYVARKTFIGADGMHRKGEPVFRKQGLPIDSWRLRGLIAEVPDPAPTEMPMKEPTDMPGAGPEVTPKVGPSETKDNELVGVQMSYRCGDCGAVFESRAALNGHMSSHRRKRKADGDESGS